MIEKFKKMIRGIFNIEPVYSIEPALEHAAFGMVTEAAEVLDVLKKYRYYGKDYQTLKLKEELGDLLFYVQAGADAIGSSLEEIIGIMIAKHSVRYPDGNFDPTNAIECDKEAELAAMLRVEDKYCGQR